MFLCLIGFSFLNGIFFHRFPFGKRKIKFNEIFPNIFLIPTEVNHSQCLARCGPKKRKTLDGSRNEEKEMIGREAPRSCARSASAGSSSLDVSILRRRCSKLHHTVRHKCQDYKLKNLSYETMWVEKLSAINSSSHVDSIQRAKRAQQLLGDAESVICQ